MDEEYLSKLWAFVDAYSRSATVRRVSEDIIEIICLFYSDKHTAFLLAIRCRNSSCQIMKLYDIYTKKSYPVDVYFTSNKNAFRTGYEFCTKSECISHQCDLPYQMRKQCNEAYNDQLSTNWLNLLWSNKWNLIFRLGALCHITALNPQFCDSIYSEPEEYYAYNFVIPTLKKCSYSRCVYNQTNQTLYKIEGDVIYMLCLTNSENALTWKVWKQNIQPSVESGASVCMVDNDRFIAVINAHEKKSYLLDMNQCPKKKSMFSSMFTFREQSMIRIADACVVRWIGYSMYHQMYHKIITVGEFNTEWYDINKNKSAIISTYKNQPKHINNAWYSPFDPNILYCTSKHHKGTPLFKTQLDLRSGQWYEQQLSAISAFVYDNDEIDCVYLRC